MQVLLAGRHTGYTESEPIVFRVRPVLAAGKKQRQRPCEPFMVLHERYRGMRDDAKLTELPATQGGKQGSPIGILCAVSICNTHLLLYVSVPVPALLL